MRAVQLKRGLRKNLPKNLACGELAYCTDTNEIYVGGEKGKPELLMHAEVLVNRTVMIHTSKGVHICIDPEFRRQVLKGCDKRNRNLAYLISIT